MTLLDAHPLTASIVKRIPSCQSFIDLFLSCGCLAARLMHCRVITRLFQFVFPPQVRKQVANEPGKNAESNFEPAHGLSQLQGQRERRPVQQ